MFQVRALKNDKPDKNTFTYLLEFGSTPENLDDNRWHTNVQICCWGKQKNSRIYFNVKWKKVLESHSEAFKETINLIADCVDAAGKFDKDKDWEKLSDTIAEKIESQKYHSVYCRNYQNNCDVLS